MIYSPLMPLDLPKLIKIIGKRPRAQVARDAGMPQPNLTRLLSGAHPDIRLSTLDRLAKALDVKPRDLIR